MSAVVCPQGHPSVATDYCDTCGSPITAAGSGSVASNSSSASPNPVRPNPTAPTPCPHCGVDSTADALFCESCGYDFTTGATPRADAAGVPDFNQSAEGDLAPPVAPSVPLTWVAEVWVDPDWFADQDSTEQCPSPGLPEVVPLRNQSVLVGRTSQSRNIHPEIDCRSDIGVSRRQAQLTTDGSRWWVEDLQSSNGTYIGQGSGALPTEALPAGQRNELAVDARVYVGAWTRIVVRRATEDEKGP